MRIHGALTSKDLVLLANEDVTVVAECTAGQFVSRCYDYGRSVIPDFAIHPQLLLIDDVCKGDWGKHSLPMLFECLDQRMRAGKRTILTAQMSVEQLWEKLAKASGLAHGGELYSRPILDRLQPCIKLEFGGPSSLRSADERQRRTEQKGANQ
jgi:hypothetical protein